VIGARGNDVAQLGSGDDTFVWNPGDGSDTVEGQAGVDTLLFNGANVAENVTISANGERALFTRNVANIAMDLNGIEHIQFNALGRRRQRHGQRSDRHRYDRSRYQFSGRWRGRRRRGRHRNPALTASSRQRCSRASSRSELGSSFLRGWRSMPGTTPPTSQLDWLISTTAMIVLFWSRATRDLLKSFSWECD
jgi:hypothetical protein